MQEKSGVERTDFFDLRDLYIAALKKGNGENESTKTRWQNSWL